MPNMNVNFGGQNLVIPGVYPQVNVTSNFYAAGTRPTTLLFIAASDGGSPNTPYYFSSAQNLISFMRGSASAAYVPFMANPSPNISVSNFAYINPLTNTASTASIKDAGATTVLTLTSASGGASWNGLTYSIASGTIGGSLVTISDTQFSGTSMSANNLGVPFALTYNGTSATLVYTVTATTFATSGSANPSENVTLSFASYPTVSALVNAINAVTNLAAYTITNPNLPTTSLDLASNIAVAAGATVNVTAILGDIVYWVNTYVSSLATAVIPGGVVSSPTTIPAPIGTTNFTGGTTQAITDTMYQASFTEALQVPCWVVFCDGSDAAVQAYGKNHAATASTLTQKAWRRFVTGSTLGEPISSIEVAARSLNSTSTTFCAPGIIQTSPTTGLPVTYPGMYFAAMVAGAMCGVPPATPLTQLSVSGVGLETNYTVSQIDQLQQAGVLVGYSNPITRTPTIVSDFTTWQNDANPENVWNQQIACQDALLYGFVTALQPYVGTVASPTTLARATNASIKYLNSMVYADTTGEGVLASWDASSLVVSYNGTTQTLTATVSVMFVGQFRFITITAVASPFSSSITG